MCSLLMLCWLLLLLLLPMGIDEASLPTEFQHAS